MYTLNHCVRFKMILNENTITFWQPRSVTYKTIFVDPITRQLTWLGKNVQKIKNQVEINRRDNSKHNIFFFSFLIFHIFI